MKQRFSVLGWTVLASLLLLASPALAQLDPSEEAPIEEDDVLPPPEVTPEPQAPEPPVRSPQVDERAPDPATDRVSRPAGDDEMLIEQVDPPAAEITPRLRVRGEITSEGSASDNLDLREYDPEERAFIDILDSDDRMNLLFTRLGLGLAYDVIDNTTIEVAASHSGVWGGNQLGAANAFGGVFYFERVFVDYRAVELDAFQLSMRFGRQPFSIGGARTDFFFDDVIDGVTVRAGFGKGGALRVLALDQYAFANRPDNIAFAGAIVSGRQGERLSQQFQGRSNTYRFGGIYENTKLLDGLELRAFGFYADIGAMGTGSDRAAAGAFGNVIDNDFNWIAGTRIGYTLKLEQFELGTYLEYARSGGIDRKATNLGLFDVTTDGDAFGAALQPRFTLSEAFGIRALAHFFYSTGATYSAANGLLFNHGFVSFRGRPTGGLNMGRYAGWRPSATLGSQGVSQNPHDVNRSAGTMMIRAGIGFDVLKRLSVDGDIWVYQDTSVSNLDPARIDRVSDEMPFGWSRADLEAQERLGRSLGTELNLRTEFLANELLSFYALAGIFLPGDFYEVEIDRVVGTMRGSETPANFWALSAGASLRF